MFGLLIYPPSPLAHRKAMQMYGVAFYPCHISRGAGKRRYLAAARDMRKHGVRRCLFPKGFLWKECFEKEGVYAVDTAPLIQKKAAEWVCCEREQRGLSGSLAIYASRVTKSMTDTVLSLLPHVRHLYLSDMCGRENFAAFLYEEWGISLPPPSRRDLLGAESLLLFSHPDDFFPENRLVLSLNGDMKPPLHIKEKNIEIPALISDVDFLAALVDGGGLSAEDIFVE